MFHFYIPWKGQKTFGFLAFSGGKEIEPWLGMGSYAEYLKNWTINQKF